MEDPSVPKEPSLHKEESPTDYPLKDHPEAPLGAEDSSVIPPADQTLHVPPDNPFSRSWSGQTADTSDTNKRRPRWLIRISERSHSVDLEELYKLDPRPYRYVLRRAQPLFPRPRFYSRYPNTSSISLAYVEYILHHLVTQCNRELDEENLEHERKESEASRRLDALVDSEGKPWKVIAVDPITSPFDSGEDKIPREDTPCPHLSP